MAMIQERDFIGTVFTPADVPDFRLCDVRILQASDTLARAVGVKPLITSSHRSPNENIRAQGAPGSQHLFGRAWDLFFKNVSPHIVVEAARRVPLIKGLAVQYPTAVVHVDVRNTSRRAEWGEIEESAIVDGRKVLVKRHDLSIGEVLDMFPKPIRTITEPFADIPGLESGPMNLSKVGWVAIAAAGLVTLALLLR